MKQNKIPLAEILQGQLNKFWLDENRTLNSNCQGNQWPYQQETEVSSKETMVTDQAFSNKRNKPLETGEVHSNNSSP